MELQTVLEEVLGVRHVYYQPPPSKILEYPAITYSYDGADRKFANDNGYTLKNRYTVTLIDKNPDSDFIKNIFGLRHCSFDRSFKNDNLNHTVFTLYF